jgi:hypothetical protein
MKFFLNTSPMIKTTLVKQGTKDQLKIGMHVNNCKAKHKLGPIKIVHVKHLQAKDPKDQLEIGMHVKYLQTKHPKDQLEIGMHVNICKSRTQWINLRHVNVKHLQSKAQRTYVLKKTCECITHKQQHKHKFPISQRTTHHKSAQIMNPTTFISRHELGILS